MLVGVNMRITCSGMTLVLQLCQVIKVCNMRPVLLFSTKPIRIEKRNRLLVLLFWLLHNTTIPLNLAWIYMKKKCIKTIFYDKSEVEKLFETNSISIM